MRFREIMVLLSAAVILTGCGSDSSSGDVPDSSSQAVTTTAVTTVTTAVTTTVTAASETVSSAPEDTSSEQQVSEADSSSQPEQPKTSDMTPAMWEVTSDNGGRLIMMGSMHALKEQDYPLPGYITEALGSCDALAVECDAVAAASDPELMLKEVEYMYYQNGETIYDHISTGVMETVKEYAAGIGMDITFYKNCKPWVYLSLFETDILKKTGMRSDLGFDTKLIGSARESGKELIELESAEAQMEMISGFSDGIMEMMLSSYVPENTEALIQSYETLYEAWRTGNFAWIEGQHSKKDQLAKIEAQGYGPETEEYKLLSDYIDQMQTDRNKGMAEKAARFLEEGRNIFLVVGSAHFCGREGIISLLEEKGYEVRRL